MLAIGDYIVKVGEGVCRVDSEITMKVPGGSDELSYYLLVPVYDPRIKVYLPKSGSYQKTEIRPVMSTEEAKNLVHSVHEIEAATVPSEKLREETYKEAIKSCEPDKLVSIIKHMYLRCAERQAQGKKNTAMDDRYFAMAEKALYSELGFVLHKTDAEVRELIRERSEGYQIV